MLETAGSLIGGHVAGKLIDTVTSKFRTCVIERWTRRRARNFFDQFCREIAADNADEADRLISQLIEDECCSEVLYDAYRSVALSKSKSLGPRIIAIVTAQIVSQRREAEYNEELIFAAAEQMNDEELNELAAFTEQQQSDADNRDKKETPFCDKSDSINVEWGEEQFDSAWHRETDVSLAPLDLGQDLGTWASKAKAIGLLSDDIKEKTWEYPEDCERFDPEPGSVREVTWWISLHSSCLQLAPLIRRAGTVPDP